MCRPWSANWSANDGPRPPRPGWRRKMARGRPRCPRPTTLRGACRPVTTVGWPDSWRRRPRPWPRQVVRNVPRDLQAIALKAARPDPARRYASARDFAEDLQRWLRRSPTAARPGWWYLRPLWCWARRYPGAAAALALALAATAGAVGFNAHLDHLRAERAAERAEAAEKQDRVR